MAIKSGVILWMILIIAASSIRGSYPSGLAQDTKEFFPAHSIADAQSPPFTGTTFALQGTAPLRLPLPEDLVEQQRQQIIHYFLNEITATPAKRDKLWEPSFSSLHAYQSSVQLHRNHLRKMLGLIRPDLGPPQIKLLQAGGGLRIEDVSLPIAGDFEAQALLFLPQSGGSKAAVIAIPPANESREEFAGITQGSAPASWLKALLESNVAVAIPAMVERIKDHPLCQKAGGKNRRHILWRAGFIVGRTLVGVEVQQVLAVQAFLASQPSIDPRRIGVLGERQGGMTALYAAAMDERLAGAAILDYFQQRENCWKEPIDRVLYGQLNEFGDAEVAALIAPRPLIIVTSSGAPVSFGSVDAETGRADRFHQGLGLSGRLVSIKVPDEALEGTAMKLAASLGATRTQSQASITLRIPSEQIDESRNEHFVMLYHYLRGLDAASDQVRKNYWQLDSTPPQDRSRKAAELGSALAHLMGIIPPETVPLKPRTALIGETSKFLAYDVFLNAVPGVEVFGQLLVPRAVAGHVGQRLPAVICQHGFDGAPKYVTGIGAGGFAANDRYYHRFGERLAERGYVVFAPYMTVTDRINPIVRMAACVGMMRTSIELAKLHRVVDFLQSRPFVDPDRIGYYGMSYGGYAAAWMPPLETRLRFTIISAYFNDLRLDLTDTTLPGHSFWSAPDEDPYSWNILNRFSHVELIAAMYPRPVCIEWGLHDPVTPPPWHKQAWKEVKAYAAAWGLNGKIEDHDFIGPHTVHGIQTFFFIDRWLRPERSAGRDYGCRDYTYCSETVAPDFHGYSLSSMKIVPYVTQRLDSNQRSVIRGRFYVSDLSPVFTGIAFKISSVGSPGDFVAKFGSQPGKLDMGQAKIPAKDVYPDYDLWYAATRKLPVKLDSKKKYYFEISAESGRAPQNYYDVYGPKPLGGTDYPSSFGLSLRVLGENGK